jgi:hypothetical protein
VADLLIIVLEGLQDQQRWNNEEYLCISLFKQLRKLLVLISGRFNYLREMEQLVALFRVQEVS